MDPHEFQEHLEETVMALHSATRVLFITGAGVSAESGLPTYRGISGLYSHKKTDEGISIEEALSGALFRTHPHITWKYIHQIEKACRGAHENSAHEAIKSLETDKEVWVLTQNVDGLHERAGSQHVIPIHGSLHSLRCTICPHHFKVTNYTGLDSVPHCKHCDSLLRPNVVLFGEMLPEAPLRALEKQLAIGFDMIFSVGTTSVFPYIAEPMRRAHHAGIPTVEINPEETEASRFAQRVFRTTAGRVLSELARRVHAKRKNKPITKA